PSMILGTPLVAEHRSAGQPLFLSVKTRASRRGRILTTPMSVSSATITLWVTRSRVGAAVRILAAALALLAPAAGASAGTTERVSVDSGGNEANGESRFRPAISADGSFVAFNSGAAGPRLSRHHRAGECRQRREPGERPLSLWSLCPAAVDHPRRTLRGLRRVGEKPRARRHQRVRGCVRA